MNTEQQQLKGQWTRRPGGWDRQTGQGISGSIWPRTWGGWGWHVSIIDELTGWRTLAEGHADSVDAAKQEAAAHMAAALPHALAAIETRAILADRAADGR